MKRYLKGCILFSLVMSVLLLSACKGESRQEPHIKITAGGQEIQGIYYGDRYNNTREEIEKRLKNVMENKNLEELPYIALKERITIEAENFKTKDFKVFDYILTKDGAIRYNEQVEQTSIVPVNMGKATIILSANPSASLSSNSEDYLPGKTIRCFVIRAEINGSSFAFAFILRTDAR